MVIIIAIMAIMAADAIPTLNKKYSFISLSLTLFIKQPPNFVKNFFIELINYFKWYSWKLRKKLSRVLRDPARKTFRVRYT
jgi:hypothetical protein